MLAFIYDVNTWVGVKKQFFLLAMIAIQAVFLHPAIAAPGDTIREAISAHIGMQNGTMNSYNEIDIYNFSASIYLSYNFSLYVPNKNDISLYVFDKNDNLLAKNFSILLTKSIYLGSKDFFIIKVFSSEFAVFPADYSLNISEIPGSPRETFRTAMIMSEGVDFTDIFKQYDNVAWFNFSADASKKYRFELSKNKDSLMGLYIFDKNLSKLASNSSLYNNKIVLSGHDFYVIEVTATEFIEFPVTYKILITEVVPPSSPPINSNTDGSISKPIEEVSSVQDTPGGDFRDLFEVDFPWISLLCIFTLPIIVNRKREKL